MNLPSIILSASVVVFANYSTGVAYRIPALTQARDGRLIAAADYRHCADDIGYGAIDLHFSESGDMGASWSTPLTLAAGDSTLSGNVWNYAYGDPCIVADRESDGVLCISCGGHRPFFDSKRNDPEPTVRHRSHDGGRTWGEDTPITEEIYSLFDGRRAGPADALFFTSGRMVQSRLIKAGSHFRLYCALPVRPGGAYVLFSDDFGESWKVLGDIDTPPTVTVDECKVEELPDGSVALSIRKRGARGFNVFHYSDALAGKGVWGEEVEAPAMDNVNACNGGFALVRARRADGSPTNLLLQSITFSRQRRDVGIFYMELPEGPVASRDLEKAWKKGLQLDEGTSAYSCLLPLADGSVAAFWESNYKDGGYDLRYRRLDVDEITLGEYSPAL